MTTPIHRSKTLKGYTIFENGRMMVRGVNILNLNQNLVGMEEQQHIIIEFVRY